MENNFADIFKKEKLGREDIITLLSAEDLDMLNLFKESNRVKRETVDRKTYFRGLIEYSNKCGKNCLYCGIRRGNKLLDRYEMTDDEVVAAAVMAHKHNYASLVLQSGEFNNERFTTKIESLLNKINEATNNELGITLSMGEQSEETYRRWRAAGAKRYLIRIETTNKELYYQIHPNDKLHNFENRLAALSLLRKLDYQVGTGVMIGLPGQTVEDLADDLLFMRDFDIDMCGMGPYLPHKDTPMFDTAHELWSESKRRDMTFKMIAVLRIMMLDINIAATTALQAIDNFARETAIRCGANVMMPNMTPGKYREEYKLYDNKPCTDEDADNCVSCMELRLAVAGDDIGYGEHGDSLHYKQRIAQSAPKQA